MSPPLAVSDNRRGRGGGRPPKRPKEGDVREIGPRSDNGVLKNTEPIWRKPRTKVSTNLPLFLKKNLKKFKTSPFTPNLPPFLGDLFKHTHTLIPYIKRLLTT